MFERTENNAKLMEPAPLPVIRIASASGASVVWAETVSAPLVVLPRFRLCNPNWMPWVEPGASVTEKLVASPGDTNGETEAKSAPTASSAFWTSHSKPYHQGRERQ